MREFLHGGLSIIRYPFRQPVLTAMSCFGNIVVVRPVVVCLVAWRRRRGDVAGNNQVDVCHDTVVARLAALAISCISYLLRLGLVRSW